MGKVENVFRLFFYLDFTYTYGGTTYIMKDKLKVVPNLKLMDQVREMGGGDLLAERLYIDAGIARK